MLPERSFGRNRGGGPDRGPIRSSRPSSEGSLPDGRRFGDMAAFAQGARRRRSRSIRLRRSCGVLNRVWPGDGCKPTCAGAVQALPRLRQRLGRAPPGQRPVSSSPSCSPCTPNKHKAVSHRTVDRRIRKWMTFYRKAIGKIANTPGLTLRVSFEAPAEEGAATSKVGEIKGRVSSLGFRAVGAAMCSVSFAQPPGSTSIVAVLEQPPGEELRQPSPPCARAPTADQSMQSSETEVSKTLSRHRLSSQSRVLSCRSTRLSSTWLRSIVLPKVPTKMP